MNLKLMQHQAEALDFLASRQTGGLFFEMGLGKTVVMLEHLKRISDGPLLPFLDDTPAWPFPCLIVCPLSVISVWEKEVEKFGYSFRVQKLTGTFQQRLDKLSQDADIYVINYEGMRILQAQLEAKKFNTLIMDESHRIKERSSQQTAAALCLGRLAPYRYVLTGTPVTKSPEDIWTQMQFVQPGSLGNFWAFRNRHIDFKTIHVRMPGGIKEIKKAHRFKNLKELEENIKGYCLRRTKKECLDLPEKIYKTIYCEMGKSQQKAYQEIKHTLAIELESGTMTLTSAASALQKLQQVCQGFVYDEAKIPKRFKENSKLEILKDLLEDISGEKIILLAWYKADIELLKAELSKKYKVLLYGGNADQRGECVQKFQEHDGPIIFLAQIETAKEGITLTAASHVIYYGNTWNYGSRVQSEDRVHRTGQIRNVIYYDLVVPGAVDEKILHVLKNKGVLADKITGDSIRLARMVCDLEE